MPLIAEIEHQRDHRGRLFPFLQIPQLIPVIRRVVPHHPQRHVPIRFCLIFQSDAGNPDIIPDPLFRHIPFYFPELSIRLVDASRRLFLQIFRPDHPLPIEQQHIDNIGKHFIIGFQRLFRDILSAQALHRPRSSFHLFCRQFHYTE